MPRIKTTSVTKICPYCEREFSLNRSDFSPSNHNWKTRVHCSRSCATKSSIEKRKDVGEVWSDAEINYLIGRIGKRPIEFIVRNWQQKAKREGWAKRTKTAIEIKCKRLCQQLNLSRKSTENYWESKELSRQLGVQLDKVRSWRRKGKIEFSTISRNKTAISRSQLRQFARTYPEELGGIDAKKLRKVLKDGQLVKAIVEVAYNAPKVGRAMTIIRLDTGDVYPSAKSAAAAISLTVNISKTSILNTAKRDTPMRNGLDFYQLDYPVYWCPLNVKTEFNETAGKLLYELYLELFQLDGYSKKSCLSVAARIAVQITVWYFRRQERDRAEGKELPVKETYCQFWQKKLIERIRTFYGRNDRSCFTQIVATIKRKVWCLFAAVCGDRVKTDLYAEEFALFYINKQQEKFYRDSFLPLNYQPITLLEKADFFVYIYGSLLHGIVVKNKEKGTKKKIGITFLKAINYIEKYQLNKEYSYDDTFQKKLNSFTNNNRNSEAKEELDAILQVIKSKVKLDEYEQIELYVALKLEEASDGEIAECMGIEEYRVRQIAKRIKTICEKNQNNLRKESKQFFLTFPCRRKDERKQRGRLNQVIQGIAEVDKNKEKKIIYLIFSGFILTNIAGIAIELAEDPIAVAIITIVAVLIWSIIFLKLK